MIPCPTVAQTRLDPIAVVTMSFALDVQVGAIPGRPGAGSDTLELSRFISRPPEAFLTDVVLKLMVWFKYPTRALVRGHAVRNAGGRKTQAKLLSGDADPRHGVLDIWRLPMALTGDPGRKALRRKARVLKWAVHENLGMNFGIDAHRSAHERTPLEDQSIIFSTDIQLTMANPYISNDQVHWPPNHAAVVGICREQILDACR
jgi:hypothetical protein